MFLRGESQLGTTNLLYGIISVTVLSIGYAFGLSIYRLYFHPLATIPGPFWAKVTDWYNVAEAWGTDRHLSFYKLHEKYGPMVRYGPSRISINSSTALSKIYGPKSNVQKSSYYSIFNAYFKVPCVLTAITHAQHAPKRKLVSQGFSDSAIHAMEEHVLVNIRKFCDLMAEKEHDHDSTDEKNTWSKARNLAQWTNYLTFDIMSTLCFSSSYGMLESDEQRWIIKVLQKATQGLNMLGHMQWIASLNLDKLFFSKLSAANERFQSLSKQMALDRYAMQDIKTKDVFYFLQNAQDPATGAKLTHEQLIAEAGLLIVAGSDTTSTAIASTIFYLLHNPKCLANLQQEIRSKFNDVEEIRGGAILNSCSFLRACTDEALRMAPGVGGILPREVLAGGLAIDNVHFPEGVDLGVPIFALHHNEEYYPKAFQYIPERWIVDEQDSTLDRSPQAVERSRSAFCPFIAGSWSCVGKGMAYKEIYITVARLVWLFDWRIAPGTTNGEGDPKKDPETMRHRKEEMQGDDWFVFVIDGPVVQFRKRHGTDVAMKL